MGERRKTEDRKSWLKCRLRSRRLDDTDRSYTQVSFRTEHRTQEGYSPPHLTWQYFESAWTLEAVAGIEAHLSPPTHAARKGSFLLRSGHLIGRRRSDEQVSWPIFHRL